MFGIRRGSAILRSPDGDPPGGGGASGGEGQSAEPPKPMTQAEIQTLVGSTVNSAITSHMKRSLGPGIAEALKSVAWGEVLAPEFAKLKPPEPNPGAGAGGEQKPDPKFSALEGQFADLKKKYDQSEAARQAAEQKARDDAAFQALRTALTPHVRPEALDIAAKNLFLADKRVTFDEQGNPLLTVRRAPFQGGAEEDIPLPLADGVKHWIGTSEGKFFAPAPGGGQQEARRPGGGPARHVVTGRDGLPTYDSPATTDDERVRRANERAAALSTKYPNL